MQLREIAHSRTGDKGSLVTISLIAYRDADFAQIEEHVTVQRVSALFQALIDGPV